MKWLKKTAVVSCALGVLASFTAIQTAKILTEEQKQLALQILNMKKPSDARRRDFFIDFNVNFRH